MHAFATFGQESQRKRVTAKRRNRGQLVEATAITQYITYSVCDISNFDKFSYVFGMQYNPDDFLMETHMNICTPHQNKLVAQNRRKTQRTRKKRNTAKAYHYQQFMWIVYPINRLFVCCYTIAIICTRVWQPTLEPESRRSIQRRSSSDQIDCIDGTHIFTLARPPETTKSSTIPSVGSTLALMIFVSFKANTLLFRCVVCFSFCYYTHARSRAHMNTRFTSAIFIAYNLCMQSPPRLPSNCNILRLACVVCILSSIRHCGSVCCRFLFI